MMVADTAIQEAHYHNCVYVSLTIKALSKIVADDILLLVLQRINGLIVPVNVNSLSSRNLTWINKRNFL